MPEQRLQRTRDAYKPIRFCVVGDVAVQLKADADVLPKPSAAYRITQAQRAAEQQMVEQSLKDLQTYAGRSSREPL